MNVINNLDALLITNPTNIRYLTGFVGAAPNEREAYVLLTKDQAFLFTNALYREEAKKLTSLKRLNLLGTFIEISSETPFAKKLTEILKRLNPAWEDLTLKNFRLGFEGTDLTVAEYQKIKDVRLVPTKDRVEKMRMIKREDEIENIRTAAQLTDQSFDFILEKLKPDVTETDIAWEIESFIRSRGAQVSFSPIVAFGRNTSQPHYSPNFTRPRLEIEARQGEALKTQDIILLDFGARVNGYCADMTRVVFMGKPKEEWRRAYETVYDAQQVALDYLASRPGLEATGDEADRLARRVIEKAGFPGYTHSLGHGVGLAIHEAPRLTVKKDVTLKPGMVVTIEPAIYIERHFGIRIEDLVYLRKDRIEVLTYTPKKMLSI